MLEEPIRVIPKKPKFRERLGFRNKTLWDWLELLIVPVVLATGAAFIQWQSGIRQANVTTNQNRQETLTKYLEQMTTLLIDKQLLNSQPDAEVRVVARARTLTALRELDGERKGQLIMFLAEAGLINKKCGTILVSSIQKQDCKPGIISLKGANLNRANIAAASVGRSKFTIVNLKGADLQGADLEGSNLQRVDLKEANLQQADLEGANLQQAILENTDIRGADFKKANLNGAILREACYNTETDFKHHFNPFIDLNSYTKNMVLESKNQMCLPLKQRHG